MDCRGLYISGTTVDLICGEFKNLNDWAPVQFDYSIIDTNLPFFACKTFQGFAHFYKVEFRQNAHFNEVKFQEEVNFDGAKFCRNAEFIGCSFNAASKFEKADFKTKADFSRTHFKRVPFFHEAKVPPNTSFFGTKMNVAGDELTRREVNDEIIALQTLRQLTASYKGHQDDAIFFALWQRAYRKVFLAPNLIWHKESYRTTEQGKQGLKDLLMLDSWKHFNYWSIRWKSVDCFTSWVYDIVSEYGSDSTRPIYWLICINFFSWIIYRIGFIFGKCQSADYCVANANETSNLIQQNPELFLVLQNLFNPTSFVSYKASLVINELSLIILGIFQFCSTYVVLVLAALAIRTKFQKGSSGDK